jgi:hypothetical protein
MSRDDATLRLPRTQENVFEIAFEPWVAMGISGHRSCLATATCEPPWSIPTFSTAARRRCGSPADQLVAGTAPLLLAEDPTLLARYPAERRSLTPRRSRDD